RGGARVPPKSKRTNRSRPRGRAGLRISRGASSGGMGVDSRSAQGVSGKDFQPRRGRFDSRGTANFFPNWTFPDISGHPRPSGGHPVFSWPLKTSHSLSSGLGPRTPAQEGAPPLYDPFRRRGSPGSPSLTRGSIEAPLRG